jgi:hypothetical protein
MVRNRVKSRPGACPDPDGWNAVLLPLLVDAQQLGMTGLLASDLNVPHDRTARRRLRRSRRVIGAVCFG